VACLLIGLGEYALWTGWWRICLLVGSGVVFYFLSFKKMGGEGRGFSLVVVIVYMELFYI